MEKEFTSISPNLVRGKIDTMILRFLQEGDKYGLEICNLVKDASGGTYVLKKPTLYSALRRLEQKKFVSGYDVIGQDYIKRRYYKLTDLGRDSFVGNKDDWRFSKVVLDRLFFDNIEKRAIGGGSGVDQDILLENLEIIEKRLNELDKEKALRHEGYIAQRTRAEEVLDSFVPRPLPLAQENAFDLPLSSGEPKITELKPFVLNTPLCPDKQEPVSLDKSPLPEETEFKPAQLNLFLSVENTEPKTLHIEEKKTGIHFDRYISPSEYAVWKKPEMVQYHAENASAILERQDKVEIRPVVKHFTDKGKCGFILYNKLTAWVSGGVFLTLLACLLLSWNFLRVTYQVGEEMMFVIGYTVLGVYLLINMVKYAVFPKFKKLKACYKRELTIRSLITASVIALIIGVNVVTGLTGINLQEHVVFFVVPSILALGIVLEGLGIFLFQKYRYFLS